MVGKTVSRERRGAPARPGDRAGSENHSRGMMHHDKRPQGFGHVCRAPGQARRDRTDANVPPLSPGPSPGRVRLAGVDDIMSPRFTLLAALGLLAGVVPAPAAEDADAVTRQEDERLLREAKVPHDAAELLKFFRKRTLAEQDRRDLEMLIVQLGHRSFAQREKASR